MVVFKPWNNPWQQKINLNNGTSKKQSLKPRQEHTLA
jgi:hypothetical protein